MTHLISSAVLVLLVVGLLLRTRSALHPKIMVAALSADFLLVLYIELTRGAVERVVSEVNALVWFHAGISTAVLGCYVVMLVLGRRLLNGRAASRPIHRNLGIAFCVLRSVNYVTSFLV